MKAISVVFARENEGVALLEKSLYLVFLNVAGKVYTVPVSDVKGKALLPVIRRRVKPDSVVYTTDHQVITL